MISPVHPALIFILGALLLPLAPGRRAKQVLLLLVTLAGIADLLILPPGDLLVAEAVPFLPAHLRAG